MTDEKEQYVELRLTFSGDDPEELVRRVKAAYASEQMALAHMSFFRNYTSRERGEWRLMATGQRPFVEQPIIERPAMEVMLVDERCHSFKDGDCTWSLCPQIRDHEPSATGRHCPLWRNPEEA